MTSNADYAVEPPGSGTETIAEQLRRKNVKPLQSPDDLAEDGVFDTDEELDAFLAHVYAARHVDAS